jgi:hypothetical protein
MELWLSFHDELAALVGRQKIGNSINNWVAFVALRAIEEAGDYFLLVLLFNRELEFPLAYGTGQDIHQLSLHRLIIARLLA